MWLSFVSAALLSFSLLMTENEEMVMTSLPGKSNKLTLQQSQETRHG